MPNRVLGSSPKAIRSMLNPLANISMMSIVDSPYSKRNIHFPAYYFRGIRKCKVYEITCYCQNNIDECYDESLWRWTGRVASFSRDRKGRGGAQIKWSLRESKNSVTIYNHQIVYIKW